MRVARKKELKEWMGNAGAAQTSMVLSFSLKWEPSQINKMDARLRGHDEVVSIFLLIQTAWHEQTFLPAVQPKLLSLFRLDRPCSLQ